MGPGAACEKGRAEPSERLEFRIRKCAEPTAGHDTEAGTGTWRTPELFDARSRRPYTRRAKGAWTLSIAELITMLAEQAVREYLNPDLRFRAAVRDFVLRRAYRQNEVEG